MHFLVERLNKCFSSKSELQVFISISIKHEKIKRRKGAKTISVPTSFVVGRDLITSMQSFKRHSNTTIFIFFQRLHSDMYIIIIIIIIIIILIYSLYFQRVTHLPKAANLP